MTLAQNLKYAKFIGDAETLLRNPKCPPSHKTKIRNALQNIRNLPDNISDKELDVMFGILIANLWYYTPM